MGPTEFFMVNELKRISRPQVAVLTAGYKGRCSICTCTIARSARCRSMRRSGAESFWGRVAQVIGDGEQADQNRGGGEPVDCVEAQRQERRQGGQAGERVAGHLRAGVLVAVDGRCPEALPLFLKAASRTEPTAEILKHVGNCQLIVGDNKGAVATLQQAYATFGFFRLVMDVPISDVAL